MHKMVQFMAAAVAKRAVKWKHALTAIIMSQREILVKLLFYLMVLWSITARVGREVMKTGYELE